MSRSEDSAFDAAKLINKIRDWATNLGFEQAGISGIELSTAEKRLFDWLDKGYHGDMKWMARHGAKRSRPGDLVASTRSIISVSMNYLPPQCHDAEMVLNHPELAYISRYALGRDYHKVMRSRLQKLAGKIEKEVGQFGYRVFVDSAPVLEKPIAVKAGLGWMGKHTNVLNRQSGSWFFLGEIYTDLPLINDEPVSDHCGECTACIDICPTQAIVAPYELDARLCISYLTIEFKGVIPESLRPLIGNRIYGCDDCQLICPWNRFAQLSVCDDYTVRHGLDAPRLLDLMKWTEQQFLQNFEGSPIRRIGYQSWRRNIVVALGNAPYNIAVVTALEKGLLSADELVKEHIEWAIKQHERRSKPVII